MAIQRKQEPSQIQVRVNFIGQQKAELIQQLGSKASYRNYRNDKGFVVEIIDCVNVIVQTKNKGPIDYGHKLTGFQGATLRVSEEQFEHLNSEFHEMEGVGAEFVCNLSADVKIGLLDIMNKESGELEKKISVTIYAESFQDITPIAAQKITTQLMDESELDEWFDKARVDQEEQRSLAVNNSQMARRSANEANEVTANMY